MQARSEKSSRSIPTPSSTREPPARSGPAAGGSRPDRTERTNACWTSDLCSSGRRREDAVDDLRDYLQAGLARSLGSADNVHPYDIEDFTQEALIRILEALDSFRGDSRFTTWAMTIALRAAYTVLRKRRSTDVSLSDVEAYGTVVGPDGLRMGGRADDDVQRNDLYEALRRAIAEALTERQRTVILADMRGATSNRIAEMLGSNRNAVYKVYHDARKNLRSALTEAGYTAGDVRAILAGTR